MVGERGLMIDEIIVQKVRELERDLGRGVFPWMVMARLPVYRAEYTLRRDMMRLVRAGRLERIGGAGARQGYRTASAEFRRQARAIDARFARLGRQAVEVGRLRLN
jgi:hypothetical protein